MTIGISTGGYVTVDPTTRTAPDEHKRLRESAIGEDRLSAMTGAHSG